MNISSVDFGYMGRNERASHFISIWRDLPEDKLKELLPEIWVLCEWPVQFADYGEWLEIFHVVGYCSDDGTECPTETLTVYRAATQFYLQGLAWTNNLETVKWFNDRNHLFGWKDSRIYRTMVSPENILGMFNERKENEVIIHPPEESKIIQLFEEE